MMTNTDSQVTALRGESPGQSRPPIPVPPGIAIRQDGVFLASTQGHQPRSQSDPSRALSMRSIT